MRLREVPETPEGLWIEVHLDRVMRERGMSLNELAERVGVTNVNLSRLKNGHMRMIRFDTLAKICMALECTPRDLLEVVRRDSEEPAQARPREGSASADRANANPTR